MLIEYLWSLQIGILLMSIAVVLTVVTELTAELVLVIADLEARVEALEARA